MTESGTLPLIPETITSISIGGITNRSKLQRGLDSYQEDDLTGLRERWSNALAKRTKYLNEQIQNLINKPSKEKYHCLRVVKVKRVAEELMSIYTVIFPINYIGYESLNL